MKLSVLIPVYNESGTILEVIDRIQAQDIGNIEKEIIIVDDASTDNTYRAISGRIEKYRSKGNIILIRHIVNSGKGFAIRTALKSATGDIILIQDADLEYDINDYPKLIKPIIDGDASVVYGSRRLEKSNTQHSHLSFFIGGETLTLITNLLYNTKITDEPTCYKTFRSDVIKSIDLKCRRFEFCPEVTAKVAKKGIRIVEVPIRYYPRKKREGKKIRWQDGFFAIWTLLKYRFFD